MATETELKLRISARDLQRLKRHPLLRRLSTDRARTLKLYNIYYDTDDLALRHNAMALRLRRIGKRWVQTLKGGGQVRAGLHQRNEWEMPVAAEQLDLDALKEAGGHLPHGVRSRLQPVFVTDFTRNVRLLDFEGAQIELCMDSGEVRAGQGVFPISELELELISGEPQILFTLALQLLEIVPIEVEHTSKAEYGYLLFASAGPRIEKAKFASLQPAQDTLDALRILTVACLTHIQANAPGAVQQLDEEYLHQVRVGLRRLRVVLSLNRRLHVDDEIEDLYRRVSDLCIALGRARDWDVFVSQTLAKVCARLPDHEGLHALLKHCERQRHMRHLEVAHSLASRDFQRLILRFGAWLHQSRTAARVVPLKKFARKTLEKRYEKVLERGMLQSSANPENLHTLRIACKKLRYSLEMFRSLFPHCEASIFLENLGRLQDILGGMNDIAVAHRLLDELDNTTRHDTLALVRGWMEHDYAERIKRFEKQWPKFAKQNKCW